MSAYTEEIQRQLGENARVKQAFSDALVTRIAEFAQRSQRIQEAHITIGHIGCSIVEHLVAAN